MKELNMKNVIEKYNDLMVVVGYEHSTIGTMYSESTENWNLRDMVAECDYLLSCYYESGNARCDMKYDDEYGRKSWYSETGKLKRFINKYITYIENMKCTEGHCSRYDN